MSCLIDLIGIKTACGATASASGIFINEQPGITSEMLDFIKRPEMSDYLVSWGAVQNNAYINFSTDFRSAIRDRFVIRQHREEYKAVMYRENTVNILAETNYRGYVIQLPNDDKAVEYQISKVTIESNVQSTLLNPQILPLKVFDFTTGVLIASTDIDLNLGTRDYNIYLKFTLPTAFNQRIFICADVTGLDLQGAIANFGSDYDPSSCYSCNGLGWQIGSVDTLLNPIQANFVPTQHVPFGMNLQLDCNFDSVFCQYKTILTNAWKLCLCSEILANFVVSPDYSKVMAARGTQIGMLADKYKADYLVALQLASDEMDLCNCGCFTKNNKYRIIWN